MHRCQAILLSADGWPVPIAQLLRVNQSTVHRWLDRSEADGVRGLRIQWGSGRRPHWDESYESLLVETVRHDPRWYGLEQSVWTCVLLAGYLAQQTGMTSRGPIGAPWELEAPGDNRKQVMFGAVDGLTGQTHFALTERKRSARFQQYVDREIIPAYAQADVIFLIVDGTSICKSRSTFTTLAEAVATAKRFFAKPAEHPACAVAPRDGGRCH